MKDYDFRLIDARDSAYPSAVEFSLPAYDASKLHHARQAFPGFVCAFRHGELAAVCGFRSAERGLFLEQFMNEPCDAWIAHRQGGSPPRSAIVELGAFRVRLASLSQLFASRIEHLLASEGFSHALALSPAGATSVGAWARERAGGVSYSADVSTEPEPGKKLEVSILSLSLSERGW